MPKMKIIFEKSHTTIGKIGRILDPYPYTHIALSFDDETFYSFSRRKHYNPFDAGFTKERLSYYAYDKKEPVELKEYELEIDEEKKNEIFRFMEEVKEYPFDIYGMIKMSLHMPREKKNAYNCMTFISYVLMILEIPLENKRLYENRIEDIEHALIRKGYIGRVKKVTYKENEDGYMDKISLYDKAHAFVKIHQKLLKK